MRKPRHRFMTALAAVLLTVAAAAVLVARIGKEFQAGAFFGAGSLVLFGLLAALGWQLRLGRSRAAIRAGRGNLLRLALLGAARHPGRATLSMALVASACFLIVSVSAFHIDPSAREPRLDSGNGRFSLVAESDLPVHHNLDTVEGRRELGFSDDDNDLLSRCVIVAFRVKPGDDASCLNLYQPRRPRLLGVPEAMIRRGGFAWADDADRGNPWRALESQIDDSTNSVSRVPMILERDTATYSLHLKGGLGATYEIVDGVAKPIVLEAVGLLKGSPFQGDLLISEKQLLGLFPNVDGYRFFLIECPPDETARIRAILGRALGDRGFAAVPVDEYLNQFLAVPNTYLSTFQSLGGLGLLLGTFGLAVVQVRNVVERRRELALLQAMGLRRLQIAGLVMIENGFLLVAGMACGAAAALVAVLPHFVAGDASIPWTSLAGMLLLILLVGLAAGLLAVRAALASPLLESLHEE